jgi:restriction endonuclease S subunit
MSTRTIPLSEALVEVSSGVGPAWTRYRVLGATRGGLALAKEPVGKAPERYKLVEPGTIFYNPMRIMIGSIAMVDDGEEPGITSPDYVVVRTRPGILHHRWFYHWLRSEQGAGMIRSLARGAVRERLLFKRLARGAITIPDWDSQVRAADKLAIIQKARAAAAAQLEAANVLPAAYLREVFESPEARGWPVRQVREVGHVGGGIQKSPDRRPVKFFRPYLTVRNVQRGYLDLSQIEHFEITEQELERLRLLPGDLLIVEGNGSLDHIGRNAVFSEIDAEWIHQNHVIRVRLSSACCPEFVSYFLNSDRGCAQMVQKAMTTSGLYTLSVSKVESLEIPTPPRAVQEAVVSRIQQSAKHAGMLAALTGEQATALDALPPAILRQAFGNHNG